MHDHTPTPSAGRQPGDGEPHGSHSMWWMIACCAPMVAVAVAVVLGVFGTP